MSFYTPPDLKPDLRVQNIDIVIPANCGVYICSEYEIGNGLTLELSSGAIMEVG